MKMPDQYLALPKVKGLGIGPAPGATGKKGEAISVHEVWLIVEIFS